MLELQEMLRCMNKFYNWFQNYPILVLSTVLFAQGLSLIGLRCFVVGIICKLYQGGHINHHYMHGNTARSAQYPQFHH